MTRFEELSDKFKQVQKSLIELQAEYKDKIRGEAYSKRYLLLIDKMNGLKRALEEYGSTGNIFKITGIRGTVNKKNSKLTINKKFELHLVNVHPEDVDRILRFRIKNLVQYNITFIKPGLIIEK